MEQKNIGNIINIRAKVQDLQNERIEIVKDRKKNESRLNIINLEIKKHNNDLSILRKLKDYSNKKINELLHDKDSVTGRPLSYFKLSPSTEHCSALNLDGKTFYIIADDIFNWILFGNLLEELSKSCLNDQDTNPEEIVAEINRILNIRVTDSLVEQRRQGSSLFLITEDKLKHLYIPLYRTIDFEQKTQILEFKGGLLHVLQHFCINGRRIVGRGENKELISNFILKLSSTVIYSTPKNIKLTTSARRFELLKPSYIPKFNLKTIWKPKLTPLDGICFEQKHPLMARYFDFIHTYESKIENEVYDVVFYYSTQFNLHFLSRVNYNGAKTKKLNKDN